MSADPADIAKYTNDGTVISALDATIKVNHIDAVDLFDQELEMFFVDPAHGQVLLDERFELQSRLAAIHEAIEVDQSLDLGGAVPIRPQVPCFIATDPSRNMRVLVRTRAFAEDTNTDRYSIEVIE